MRIYEGKENYIFVSYAHKDSDRVVPIIEALDDAGYRVWYDAGIEAGSEWPENVAEHLCNSKVVLVFLSQNALNSQNCTREIHFAVAERKEILVVYLQELNLTAGMRMQLGTSQAIFYNPSSSLSEFIPSLKKATLLNTCQNTKPICKPIYNQRIAYRETIRGTAEAEGKFTRALAGMELYTHVKIRFSPCKESFIFEKDLDNEGFPSRYEAIEKSLRTCISNGPLAGYPVTGVRAVLCGISYNDAFSDFSFEIAAAIAYKEGLKNAKPVLLEPIHQLKISTPDDHLGDIMSDISGRRGRIIDTNKKEDLFVISAEVPFAEITTYEEELRSLTHGRGTANSKFLRYDEVPTSLAKKIIEDRRKSGFLQ